MLSLVGWERIGCGRCRPIQRGHGYRTGSAAEDVRWCGCSGDTPRGLGCWWLIGLPGVARSMIGGDSLSPRKIGVFLFWETSWYFVKSYKLFCKWLTKGVHCTRQFRYATDTNIIFRRKRIVSNFLNFSQHSSVDENVF